MSAKGGLGGVDSAALADLEAEVGEIKRHVLVVDDVKVQLMAVSDRLNALTEYLVSDTRSFPATLDSCAALHQVRARAACRGLVRVVRSDSPIAGPLLHTVVI